MKLAKGTKAFLDINTNMLWAAWYTTWVGFNNMHGVHLSYNNTHIISYANYNKCIEVHDGNLYEVLNNCGINIQLCDEHPTFLSERIRSTRITKQTNPPLLDVKEFIIKSIGDRADRY